MSFPLDKEAFAWPELVFVGCNNSAKTDLLLPLMLLLLLSPAVVVAVAVVACDRKLLWVENVQSNWDWNWLLLLLL